MNVTIEDVIRNYKIQTAKAAANGTMNKHYEEKKLVIECLEKYRMILANQTTSLDGSKMTVPEIINTPANEVMFTNISKALGYPLFEYQKIYILTGKDESDGMLTALIVRQLLMSDSDPIDLSSAQAIGYYHRWDSEIGRVNYINKVIDIHDKLLDYGIPVRKIIKDANEYYMYLNSIKEQDKRKATASIHEGNYRVDYYVDK